MWKIADRWISMLVLCAISIHYTWAFVLVFEPTAIGSTGINAIYTVVPSPIGVAIVCYTVASLALLGLFARNVRHSVWLLIPQQIVLMFSAAGALAAMYLHQYADGAVRPLGFIIAGQVDTFWLAVWHTFAIVAHNARLRRVDDRE